MFALEQCLCACEFRNPPPATPSTDNDADDLDVVMRGGGAGCAGDGDVEDVGARHAAAGRRNGNAQGSRPVWVWAVAVLCRDDDGAVHCDRENAAVGSALVDESECGGVGGDGDGDAGDGAGLVGIVQGAIGGAGAAPGVQAAVGEAVGASGGAYPNSGAVSGSQVGGTGQPLAKKLARSARSSGKRQLPGASGGGAQRGKTRPWYGACQL